MIHQELDISHQNLLGFRDGPSIELDSVLPATNGGRHIAIADSSWTLDHINRYICRVSDKWRHRSVLPRLPKIGLKKLGADGRALASDAV
jgi:hypothetical protein